MSTYKRRCVTCKHFADAQMSGNGWCTHPKRQISSDVRILVRKGELACRNSWGGDLWESGDAVAPTPIRKPLIPDSGVLANDRTEDQVTSVRASGPDTVGSDRVVFSDPSFRRVDQEDVIVDHSSVSPAATPRDIGAGSRGSLADDDGLNTPAQEDQHERAQDIARGSRNAILRARERHTQKRRGTDRLPTPLLADGDRQQTDAEDVSQTAPGEHQAPIADAAQNTPERGAANDFPDSIGSGTRRFGRRAHIHHDPSGSSASGSSVSIEFSRSPDDGTAPVPPSEARSDSMNLVSRKVDRERFDTVPEIKPTIELPRIRQFLQSGDTAPADLGPSPTAEIRPASLSSYDLVLRRAQAIKSASKADRGGRPSRAMIPLPRTASTPAEPTVARAPRAERVKNLPPIDWEYETEPADAPFSGARLPDLDAEPAVSGRRGHDELPIDMHHPDVRQVEEPDDEWFEGEIEEFVDDDDTYTHTVSEEDHSRSWWRGLGFSRTRRQPDYADSRHVDLEMDTGDPYEPALISAADGGDPDDDGELDSDPRPTSPGWSSSESVRVRSSRPRATPTFHRGEPRQPRGETLDDSPISGRRIEASARSGQPPSDDDTGRIDTSLHDIDSNSVIIRERVQRRSRELVVAGAGADPREHGAESDHDPSSRSDRFALSEEHGMDAFRSALFQPVDSAHVAAAAPERRLQESGGAVSKRSSVAIASSPREPRQTSYQPLEEEPRVPRSAAMERSDGPWDEPELQLEFDIRKLVVRQDDLLDMTISLAPDLPRTCQTCRDFRPSENGERGWCTNDWAFTHRQMVNADSLPCQSSIGCWWLPNDASWMPALRPEEHRRTTPRTDRLVARLRPERERADAEPQELYVREI